MKIQRTDSTIKIQGNNYCLKYDSSKNMYVELEFNNKIGATLFVASGCDRDEMIDELVTLKEPTINETSDFIELKFIKGRRSYLINRLALSDHIKLIEENKFNVLTMIKGDNHK